MVRRTAGTLQCLWKTWGTTRSFLLSVSGPSVPGSTATLHTGMASRTHALCLLLAADCWAMPHMIHAAVAAISAALFMVRMRPSWLVPASHTVTVSLRILSTSHRDGGSLYAACHAQVLAAVFTFAEIELNPLSKNLMGMPHSKVRKSIADCG